MFFEINHLPSSDSLLLTIIKLLFSILFRLGNTIFPWGSMSDELKSAVRMNLFIWPISALLINLQDLFLSWYYRAQSPCEVCNPNQSPTMVTSSTSLSICSHNSPYLNLSNKWSLQNAILYTINRFLDKLSTREGWSVMLDVNYSPLSSSEQRKRVNYAIYDCFAVTLLHRAIYKKWSLIQLREAELTSLFTSNTPTYLASLSSSNLLENISEDESEENDQIILSSTFSHRGANIIIITTQHVQIASNVDDIEIDTSRQQLISNEPPKPRRSCRSLSARIRRNRRRNVIKHLYRDRYVILRKVYYRFTLRRIKTILNDRNIRYIHLKLNKSSRILSIGMKTSSLVDLYFDRLPSDLFDKRYYQQCIRHEH